MSNYGQQPPLGQNPYGQQPGQPWGQPQQPPAVRSAAAARTVSRASTVRPTGPDPYTQPPYGQPRRSSRGTAATAAGQWIAQHTRKPSVVARSIPVVTMDAVPGREIAEVVGDVVGVVARTRELRPDLRGGNPIDGYVDMLTESRQDAVGRLAEMAEAAGADAVVGLRFDCSEITQSLSEVAAYGTAVREPSRRSRTPRATRIRRTRGGPPGRPGRVSEAP